MKRLKINRVFCFTFICLLFFSRCTEEKSKCSEYIITGKYQNETLSETIIILDTVNYVHQYRVNGILKSDTSTYWFSSTAQEPQCLNTIQFRNFYISDSSFYWTYESNLDGSFYMGHFEYYYYTDSSAMVVNLDDNNNVLYLQRTAKK